MSIRSDVLLWAQRIMAREGAPPHQLLEIEAGAGVELAQDAFHKLACVAHPDLHRGSLPEDELALVAAAYARVAAAYQDLRDVTLAAGRRPALRADPPPPRPADAGAAAGPPPPGPPGTPGALSPRALLHFRRAERCLRRGELRDALLQLKMAIACDPQSALLRAALAEVEAEVGK